MQKELKLRSKGPNYEIYYEGGGQLPAELEGLFSDKRFAQNAINKYLSDKQRKEVKDGTKPDTPVRNTKRSKAEVGDS